MRSFPFTGILLVALAASPPVATAHVEYVAERPGADLEAWSFFVDTVTESVNALLLALGAVTALALAALALALRRRVPDVHVLLRTLTGYADLVPWMLRLSVGIPLLGAGFAGYLYSPEVEAYVRLPQVLLGFLLLFGLATRVAAALALAGYLWTLALHGADALLAFEFVAGFLAIILVGAGRPSADEMLDHVARTPGTVYHGIDPVHRLGAWWRRVVGPAQRVVPALVRVVVGVTFAYLGLAEKLLQPGLAMAVVEDLGLDALLPIDPRLWVIGAGGVELLLGIVLIAGVLTRAAAAVAFVVLTVTLLALPNDPVLPHVTLFGLASVVFTWGAGPWSVDAWLRRGDASAT